MDQKASGSRLQPGDCIFLAFLLRRPRSAYDLKKATRTAANHFWTAAHSQVYQQANRLVRDGYVKERPTGDARGTRILSLTPRGRRAVLAWLRTPAPLPSFFSEGLAKLYFAGEADDPKATLAMLEDQLEQIVARDKEQVRMRADMQARGRPEPEILALDIGISVNRGALEAHRRIVDHLRDTTKK